MTDSVKVINEKFFWTDVIDMLLTSLCPQHLFKLHLCQILLPIMINARVCEFGELREFFDQERDREGK